MARIPNQYLFVSRVVDTDRLFDPNTKSYIVVGVRDAFDYVDGKKTENIIGKNVTVMCTKDTEDYGKTKKGKKIANLAYEQFDIKVSNTNFEAPKGTPVKIELDKLEKAVGYENSFGEQVSILFSDLTVMPKQPKQPKQ